MDQEHSYSISALDEFLANEANEHLNPKLVYNFLYNIDDLTDDDRVLVETHLVKCDRCKDQVETLKVTYGG